jgi:hypothetical protein
LATYDYDTSGNLIGKEGVNYTYQAHFVVRGVAKQSGSLFSNTGPMWPDQDA